MLSKLFLKQSEFKTHSTYSDKPFGIQEEKHGELATLTKSFTRYKHFA